MDMTVSLMFSACFLNHIHCLSHLKVTTNSRWARVVPNTENTREEKANQPVADESNTLIMNDNAHSIFGADITRMPRHGCGKWTQRDQE
jgi:hypothetical protein